MSPLKRAKVSTRYAECDDVKVDDFLARALYLKKKLPAPLTVRGLSTAV